MATYRQVRITPDMPAQRGRRSSSPDASDEDTPPASPYQNRFPRKPPPSLKVGNLFTLTLPRPQTLIAVGLILLSIGWLFTPRQYKPRLIKPTHNPSLIHKNVDWRMYAYIMFAADPAHVCASLMVFDQLQTLGSKAERVLFYPQDWDTNDYEHRPMHVDKLFNWARLLYDVETVPVKVHGMGLPPKDQKLGRHRYDLPDGGQMDPSITKFLAISQTHYFRVIYLDPHVSLLKHLDELFLAPEARMAVTRRYSTNPTTKQLSAHFFLTTPREEDAESLFDLSSKTGWANEYYDSHILTEYYTGQAMTLSHRHYGLNAAEFRREDHFEFLGNEWEEWNPERVMREASMILFDEEPLPKPWIDFPSGMPDDILPPCAFEADSDTDISCRNRKIWVDLHNEYKTRRQQVCKMLPGSGGKWKGEEAKEEEKSGDA